LHQLSTVPHNIHWGYFDRAIEPALTIKSGAAVHLEAITHHAGDAPDLLMNDSIRELFANVKDRGPGPHILTGPIAIEEAQPGDMLEVEIQSLRPLFDHGSNLAANWGYLYRDFGKERVTIWVIDQETMTARAEFAFDWITTPMVSAPGTIVTPGSAERVPVAASFMVPLRPHLGTMGVAPAEPGRHSSVPPGDHGGNIDNWRAGPGTKMYYPVQVPGGLLSIGDPHLAQGDAELSGTALEASLDVVLRIRVRTDLRFPAPLLETPTHWYVHGFGDSLDAAMGSAARRTLDFLQMMWSLSADEAYSLTSLAVDFSVTQVVDQRLGVHAAIAKSLVGAPDGD